MATILLQAAGAALGSVFGPVGAALGRAAGALAGSVIDRSIINGTTTISGARLGDARIPGAEDGTAITRAYGTVRIGGTLIWATRFEEEVRVERRAARRADRGSRPFATMPISRSGSARARSPAFGGSGRMGARSI